MIIRKSVAKVNVT